MIGKAKLISLIGTTRAEEAKVFYRDTLGLKFVTDDQFAVVFDMDGATLRLSKVPGFVPSAFAVLGLQVTDINAEIDAIVAKGVKMERYTFFQQDERGVWAGPDGTKVAWFKDPDFNILSFVQPAG